MYIMSLSTLQPLCYWTITPLFAIATVTTVARTYIRLFIKSFGLDDWTSIILLVGHSLDLMDKC